MMIWIDYKIHRRLINTVSVITIPYMVIIPANNLYGVKYLFFPISNSVILMILCGLFFFFCGSVLANFRIRYSRTKKIVDFQHDDNKLHFYRVRALRNFVIFIDILCVIRFFTFIRQFGFSGLSKDEEENLISGVVGHLYLMIYAILPVLFYYWLNNKKDISYLLPYVVALTFSFFSFTKYHSIGLIIYTYLMVSLEDHKYIKKGVLLMSGIVIAIFVSNYLLGFFSRGVLGKINSDFYFLHLWKYCCGSVIHDNEIFNFGYNVGVSIFIKLLYCLVALPNMFLSVINMKIVFPIHIYYDAIGTNGEASNVLDAIGYLYPSGGTVLEVISFMFVMTAIGFVFSALYNKAIKGQKAFPLTICVFLTFFEFLSFFGTFAIKSMPWEIAVYSVLLPPLFSRRVRFKLK